MEANSKQVYYYLNAFLDELTLTYFTLFYVHKYQKCCNPNRNNAKN